MTDLTDPVPDERYTAGRLRCWQTPGFTSPALLPQPMRAIPIQEFDPRRIGRQSREAIYLDVTVTPAGLPVRQTALVIGGARDGPLLLIVGGIHGDEYEGPLAIMRLYDQLDPEAICGSVVAVTVCNVLAYETATRSASADGLDLNRVFPGDPKGSITEQIAHWMADRLVRHADFCIDFHSGGCSQIPLLCAYNPGQGPAAELRQKVAESFHTPVCMANREFLPTQLEGYAGSIGVPLVYTECPISGLSINMPAVDVYQRGARNTMRVLDMLDGPLEGEPSACYLYDPSDDQMTLNATASGFFVAERSVMDKVQDGDRLGFTCDLTGRVLEEFRAPADGVVFLRRWDTTIRAGDERVFALALDRRTW